MHIALLHLLATQATPPGTFTIGEGVALSLAGALVGVSVAYGVMRSQLNSLTDRVEQLEKAAPATTLARLEERLAAMDKSIGERLDALRRELHASLHPRHRDGE